MEKFVLMIFAINHASASLLSFNKHTHGMGDSSPSNEIDLASANTQSLPEDKYFTQKLDHFNPTEKRVWQQRYWKVESFYESPGPAFLWINGEAMANPKSFMTAQWISYAQNLGAMCFALEHRYYGKSRPAEDTSTENLLYLSTEQAIADIANFIIGMNKMYNLPSQTKWIAFGGSYAGSLAAWARMKYSDVIHGAVNSSGPSLFKVDVKEYFESAKKSLTAYNPKCPEVIKLANEQIHQYTKDESGRQLLTKTFQLCNELGNNQNDITNLFVILANLIAIIVQYNKDNRNSPTKSITIETICDILVKENVSPITLYSEVIKLILKAFDVSCLNPTYQDLIDTIKKIDYETAAETDRQWRYQTCKELGCYPTSSHPCDLFGARFTVDYFIKVCEDVFGEKFNRKFLDEAVTKTNENYGGLEIDGDRTVYVHGSIDPWHTLGITQAKPGKRYDVIFIEGGAHCSDAYASSTQDSEEVKAARKKILELLRSWTATT